MRLSWLLFSILFSLQANAGYFFQSGGGVFFNKNEFSFDGSEKWYGIFSDQVKSIEGIRLTNSQTGERNLYTDRKQLAEIENDVFSISVSDDDNLLFAYTGLPQIKQGSFKKAVIGKPSCISYEKNEDKGSDKKTKGKVKSAKACVQQVREIEFAGSKSKLITEQRVKEQDFNKLEYFYEKNSKRVSLGSYINGGVSFSADLNHDGDVDFVIMYDIGEGGEGYELDVLLSNGGKWEKIYSGNVSGL